MTGNRLLLSQALSEKILQQKLEPESWSFADWRRARRAGEIKRLAPLVSLPLGPLRRLRSRDWRGAQGCNLGIWRSDLIAVDGFEGAFASWGREDFRSADPPDALRHPPQGRPHGDRRAASVAS